MDYEKKYKEALERAREALNDGTISSNTIAYLQDIFPELKESEDEKIRKNIITYLKQRRDRSSSIPAAIGSWIAWLEKQGEQKSWSEEDEKRLKSCLNIIQAKGMMGVTDTINTKWLKSLKERIGG